MRGAGRIEVEEERRERGEARRIMSTIIPMFEPHPLLRDGHSQTIVGRYLPAVGRSLQSTSHDVILEDGDRLRVTESIPRGWEPEDPAVLMIHGLAGSACIAVHGSHCGSAAWAGDSRCADEPTELWRGIWLGEGGLSRGQDGRRAGGDGMGGEAGSAIADWADGLLAGGNLALKLAAEATAEPGLGLDCVLSANAPLDLAACCGNMRRPINRLYDRAFARVLVADVRRLHRIFPELGKPRLSHVHSVYDFDQMYTAPRHGFAGAEDYYARSSTGPMLSRIRVPGLIVHSEDDPFIPAETYHRLGLPSSLTLELTPAGGHLGYISKTRWDGDRRWLDSRLVAWLADHWARQQPSRSERDSRIAPRTRQGGPSAHV